jgi:hypothetical protein
MTTIKEEIEKELESTRSVFKELVYSVPDSDWNSMSKNSAWTKKEELWHIAWGTQFILDVIKNGRRGIGFPAIPSFIFNRFNEFYSRFRARNADRESIVKRFFHTLDAAVAELNDCSDVELEKQVRVFGKRESLTALFKGIKHHLEEHQARINPQ